MNYFTEKPEPCRSFSLELHEPDPYLAEIRKATLKPAGSLTQYLSDDNFLWKHLLFKCISLIFFMCGFSNEHVLHKRHKSSTRTTEVVYLAVLSPSSEVISKAEAVLSPLFWKATFVCDPEVWLDLPYFFFPIRSLVTISSTVIPERCGRTFWSLAVVAHYSSAFL